MICRWEARDCLSPSIRIINQLNFKIMNTYCVELDNGYVFIVEAWDHMSAAKIADLKRPKGTTITRII